MFKTIVWTNVALCFVTLTTAILITFCVQEPTTQAIERLQSTCWTVGIFTAGGLLGLLVSRLTSKRLPPLETDQ